MGLTWALADLDGRELARIDQRTGGLVEIPLDGIRRTEIAVSPYDPVVAEVYPLARRVKAWLNGHIVFHGPLIAPKWDGGSGTVTLRALGPGHQLERAFVPVPDPWIPDPSGVAYGAEFVLVDQSEIVAQLVELADITSGQAAAGIPRHGIVRGSLPTSVDRERHYEPGKQVWQAIYELSQVIDGPDFDLRPLDAEDGTTAALDTYPDGQGTDRFDDIELHFGTGLANCQDMGWEPDGTQVINDATSLGQAEFGSEPPHYRSLAQDSLLQLGKWEWFEGRPDLSQAATVEEHAQSAAAAGAFAPDILDVTPATEAWRAENPGVGVPPRIGPPTDTHAQYWLGDTIHAVGKQGYVSIDLAARVTKITLREQGDAGHVRADLEVAPAIYGAVVT